MQTGLHRNTISKVYRQLETDGVVEAIAGSGIYVRDQQKKRGLQNNNVRRKEVTDVNQEIKRTIDTLLSAGHTLQETRKLFIQEIDWRLQCGERVLVSTPKEDIGASMLIAAELEPSLNVPIEVIPMEELGSVLESSNIGTVVTSRYFLQPLEELAKQYGVRAIAVDLSDFAKELEMLKGLRTGSCVGIVSISPGILRAAEVILHSIRGNELLLMTANPQTENRLLALLRAANYVLCDNPSFPLVEKALRKHQSQLIRMPQIHCAEKYLSSSTLERLQKEIGLLK